MKKLQCKKSQYDVQKWDFDETARANLLHHICEYPYQLQAEGRRHLHLHLSHLSHLSPSQTAVSPLGIDRPQSIPDAKPLSWNLVSTS